MLEKNGFVSEVKKLLFCSPASVNSNQEMDKDKRADKEAAAEEEEEEEKHTQYVKKAEQKPEEEQEAQEKHAISDPSPPTTRYPPPQSHRYHKSSSAPLDSSSPSSLSSDHSSHNHELKRSTAPTPDTPPAVVANWSFWTNTVVLDKVDPGAQDGFSSVREVEVGSNSRGVSTDGGGGSRRLRPNLSILRRARRDNMVKKTLLWLRIFAFVFCLISFSVMAADKNQGWALDSFQRYKEFRYYMVVNVVGFAYSGLQAYDLVNYFINGKHIIRHHLRYYFDFSMDQVLTYLLISASSAAATRVYDWQSNWGKDKFPEMASASVGLSFVAFVAFALSSLFSGYTLFKTS